MASIAVPGSPTARSDTQGQREPQQEEGEERAAPAVPPRSSGPRYQYQLLYSKSRVTLHPTPYSKDNIPGYLALLRRHKVRKQSVDSQASSSSSSTAGPSSQPLRRQFSTQDNSYDVMLSWLPEELVKDRSETAKFVDVELREAEGASQRGEEETECTVMHSDSGKVLSMREVVENESILVQPPPLASPSTSPTSPASYAFSHPLGMLYSLQATPPTISNWYGSLTICLVGGQTLAPLYFHDDESRTTILGMLRASKAPAYPPTIVSPSAPSPPAWGGDELVQQLKKYAFIHRSVHDHRIFLVNPDPEDLEMHSTPTFADDALDVSPTAARRRQSGRLSGMSHDAFAFPDDPFAPSYGSRASDSGTSTPTRDSNRDSFSSWAKTTRMSLLSSFSHVTRSARDASRQILTSPNTAPYAAKLPAAVQSFAQAGPLGPFGPTSDDVSKLSQKAGVMEYDSARVYLAKWARLVAEEGERSKRREEAKGGAVEGGRTSMTEEGGLGGFEILERGSSTPLQLTRRYDPVPLVEFQSWFDPHDGRPIISFDEFKSRVFARGLAASTRKLAWPFLLDIVPWNTSAAERSAYFAEKAEKYRRLKSLWAAEDSPSAQALRERDDVVDQRHRIRVDCLRTDRKQPMFSSGAKTDGDGGEDCEEEGSALASSSSPVARKASLAGIQSRQAGQGDSTNAHILTLGEVLLTYTFYDTLGPAAMAEADVDYGKLLEGKRIDGGEVGGYVQGMSDLCAPLYIISEGDEVEAFWSLVGLMKRMVYFSLPATTPASSQHISPNESLAAGLPGLLQLLPDTVTLRTFLVSTTFTQNETLLRLLHWERQLGASSNFEDLKTVLTQFTFVGEVEVVKFLCDIFDALFAIVMHPKNSDGGLDDLVLKALVTVLSIVQDRRFNNFRATLDAYIDKHFSFQAAHSRLMDSMARLLADPTRSDVSKDLRASIKVWPYLFRFIIKGRENQRKANDEGNAVGGGAVDDHLETKFRGDLDAILRSINRLMAATSPPSIVGTQALALQHFAGILPHLAKVFTPTDLVRYECNFADSLFVTKGRMVIWKLLHIIQVLDGPLFDHDASRAELVPSVVRWIRPHLGSFTEASTVTTTGTLSKTSQDGAKDTARITWMESARLAFTVLAVVLDRIQISIADLKKVKGNGAQLRAEQDSVDYVLPLLPRILETYRELESEECTGALERHRSPSTIASAVPVIFPSAYPFPLISRWPDEHQSKSSGTRHSSGRCGEQTRLDFLHCGLGESATVLIMLIMLSPRKHLAEFLDEQLDLGGPDQLSPFLTSFCAVATSILRNEAYPAGWLNINILAHQMVLKMADPLSALLVRDFIPAAEDANAFDKVLWHDCLDMLLTLLSSEQLVVEQFKPQRRRAVWRLAGDIRGEGAQIFVKLWDSIGLPERRMNTESQGKDTTAMLNTAGFQVRFVPNLVEPVLQLCLSHHDELRTCAVRILATMITSEWHLNGSFAAIEGEIIDKLDALFRSRSKGDEISRVFFIGQLRSFFDGPDVDKALQEQISTCLISVNRFLDLLLNVRSLPPAEGFDDDRVAGTLKLLGFLRQANRVTAFSAHVLRLVNVHLNSHSYVEAALTLKLHADLLTWELDTIVDPIPELSLPRQSNFARKEKLYMLILDYLGKGQAWEISVDICRELAQQYEYIAVDYVRLSEVLAYQASLFSKIATQERTFPSYFRIAFWGSGWPELLQQKMYIYRGLDWEKLSTFAERLQQKHPAAILLKTSADIGDDVKDSEAQYLQVTAVKPEPDRNRDVFTNADVPPCVRSYYEHNATNLFSFTRPLRPEDGRRDTSLSSSSTRESLLAEVWVEKTFLRCEDAFPTVLRRSEVMSVHVTEISPIQHALDDVQAKTVELTGLEKKCAVASQGAVKVDTNRLAMTLNGAVDAPLNGGIPLYRRAFLIENEGAPPQDADLVERLRQAIDDHASTLCRCLKIHARLCAPEMKPFHDALEGFFAKNFAEEIERLRLSLDAVDEIGPPDNGAHEGERGTPPAGPTPALNGGHQLRERSLSCNRQGDSSARYILDDDNRLRRVLAESSQTMPTGGSNGISNGGALPTSIPQSPLQRHIALMNRQTSLPGHLGSEARGQGHGQAHDLGRSSQGPTGNGMGVGTSGQKQCGIATSPQTAPPMTTSFSHNSFLPSRGSAPPETYASASIPAASSPLASAAGKTVHGHEDAAGNARRYAPSSTSASASASTTSAMGRQTSAGSSAERSGGGGGGGASRLSRLMSARSRSKGT